METYMLPTVEKLINDSFNSISFKQKLQEIENRSPNVPIWFKSISLVVALVCIGLINVPVTIVLGTIGISSHVSAFAVGIIGGWFITIPLIDDIISDSSNDFPMNFRNWIFQKISPRQNVNSSAFYKKVEAHNDQVNVSIWSLAGEKVWSKKFGGVEEEEEITDCILSVNVLIEQANHKMEESIIEDQSFVERIQRLAKL